MYAGRLKHRLELLRPVGVSDAFGEIARSRRDFESAGTVRAERVTLRGTARREASEEYPDFTAQFRIRDAHRVDNGWRCRQLGGYLYVINNVIPNEERGFLTLECSRVNE